MFTVKGIGRLVSLFLSVTALVFALQALPARGEVAVVDVARVIDASNPGKEGQRRVDNLKKELDAEMDSFRKGLGTVKENDPRLVQKQAQLVARYQAEFSRISGLLMVELRRVTNEWLKGNKKGVTVVVPASSVIAASPSTDINAEILRLFNAVTMDFNKK
ncbi:OmpH family outer membrane protein [Cloacibacillus porcorum]